MSKECDICGKEKPDGHMYDPIESNRVEDRVDAVGMPHISDSYHEHGIYFHDECLGSPMITERLCLTLIRGAQL
tara:strand:+ start:1295 stop:1516 length:222 start_codon:yes stop_codon:yes gene_type:complete